LFHGQERERRMVDGAAHENVLQFKTHNRTQEQPEQEGITAFE
jgi:hypothetical protein